MPGISGFIDYKDDGTPYMGLMIEDGITRVSVYLGNKQTARAFAKGFSAQIIEMANDLVKTEDKIVLAKGLPDAAFRRKQDKES